MPVSVPVSVPGEPVGSLRGVPANVWVVCLLALWAMCLLVLWATWGGVPASALGCVTDSGLGNYSLCQKVRITL